MKIGRDFGRDFINPKSKSHPKAQAGKTCKALFIRLSVLCTLYAYIQQVKRNKKKHYFLFPIPLSSFYLLSAFV